MENTEKIVKQKELENKKSSSSRILTNGSDLDDKKSFRQTKKESSAGGDIDF